MTEKLTPTPEEVLGGVKTPERIKRIIEGLVLTAISLGLTPEQAGEIYCDLSEKEAERLAHLLGGVADGDTVRWVGQKLQGKQLKR